MGPREEQHVGRPVRAQVVEARVHALHRGIEPALDVGKKVGPIDGRAPRIRRGVGRASGGWKSAEDGARRAPAVVNLLARPAGWAARLLAGGRQEHPLARPALGRFRTHLVETDDDAAGRGGGVELLDLPLFSANSGSTRSPNHVSCWRHRKPSASKSSSRRLRFMAIPWCSARYATKRSSVHALYAWPSVCGSVSAVAMIVLTCSRGEVGGRPRRGWSASPASPCCSERCSHK